jgi:hypothetical protein
VADYIGPKRPRPARVSSFPSADQIGDNLGVKTTRYFEDQVLRKRPYLRREWCEQVVAKPLRVEVQSDGRIRHWGVIPELGRRVLRVVTLEDGETIHNAFLDRDFVL